MFLGQKKNISERSRYAYFSLKDTIRNYFQNSAKIKNPVGNIKIPYTY
jgi:hypothetical protein